MNAMMTFTAVPRADKVALIAAFEASGLTNREFARRANITEACAHYLRDERIPNKIETIDNALRVFGKRVEIRVVEVTA